jgi:hypothetical protein
MAWIAKKAMSILRAMGQMFARPRAGKPPKTLPEWSDQEWEDWDARQY